MISNTSCPELNLVEKVGFLSDEYQQIFQFTTSTPASSNNNNKVPNNKIMSSTPFTFYTSGSVCGAGDTANTECTNVLIQQSSDGGIANKLNSPFIVQSKECIDCEPCSFYDPKPEHETKKMFKTVSNYSALNGVVDGGTGSAIVSYTNETEKTAGDTSINGRCSNENNNNSRSSKSDRHKSPMCRTEDQENAFRQIEDVHNYSKLNRYGYSNGRISRTADVALYSSNSSNQEDDEDDDDDDVDEEEGEVEEDDEEDVVSYEKHIHSKVEVLSAIGRQCDKIDDKLKSEKFTGQVLPQNDLTTSTFGTEEAVEIKVEEDNIPPDHHARRPMNAFLIFCKRHRGIVKNKYKNFENRLITKILGEWWASLDTNDKKCYVNLAKQNKDAFFSANPNFKWYKLPAPSLRTLHTRPGNIERSFPGSGECEYDLNDSPTQTAITYHTISPNATFNRNDLKKVAYFKLADETQMGELNNLMRPTATSTSEVLHEALGETSDYFKADCKRSSTSYFDDCRNTKRLHSENSFSSSEEDHMPKKSSRSCKGKKYQELINSGQISAVIPKKQVSPKPSRPIVNSTNQQSATHTGHCNVVTTAIRDEQILATKDAQSKVDEEQYMLSASYVSKIDEGQYMLSGSYESPSKQHLSFVSFDLEDKIKALPAQCLETYLQRKKNTKRKKKINSKKRSPPQPKIETVKSEAQRSQLYPPKSAQEAKEQVVGSQKRKARKESITRRDINSIQNDVQLLMTSAVNSVVTGADFSVVPQTLIAVNHNATSDLLILAEVAANHTEIAP